MTVWLGSGAIGSILGGCIADRFGRRTLLMICQFPILISWLLIALASNVWCIHASRLLSGVADGAIYAIAPVYLAEISHPRLRGEKVNASDQQDV